MSEQKLKTNDVIIDDKQTVPEPPSACQFDRFSSHRYVSPTPGRLPIGVYLPNAVPEPTEESVCRTLNQIGINLSFTSVEINKIELDMSRNSKWGIKTVITPSQLDSVSTMTAENLLELFTPLIKTYNHREDTGGYMIAKNPSAPNIRKLNQVVRLIAGDVDSATSSGSSSATPLIFTMLPEQNVAPDLAIEKWLNTGHTSLVPASYLIYVQKNFGPGVWFGNPDAWYINEPGANPADTSILFNSLETYSLLARYTNRPMWATVRCQQTPVNTGLSLDNSECGSMMFAAMTALAYGAQGIVFTNFRQTEGGTVTGTVGASADMSALVKKVTDRIKKLEGIFLGSWKIQVCHSGESTQGQLYNRLLAPVGPMMELVQTIAGKDPEVLVSQMSLMPSRSMLAESVFEGEALNMLVVVNRDFHKSQTVGLRLSDFYTVTKVNEAMIRSYTDRSKNTLAEVPVTCDADGIAQFTIPAGDALVLRWK